MGSSVQSLRRLLLGEPLPTARAIHERLPKILALPVFSADAISSAAYATEEILLALMAAGTVALVYSPGIAVAIALLFTIVAISYRQTVMAYPSGGGSYIVAHQNLGVYPGLIAAAALLTDYVLTVAVSIASGVAAIISAAPGMEQYRVPICLLLIWFIALANLRGARESGTLFAGPTYLFVASVVLMIVVGAVRQFFGGEPATQAAIVQVKAVQPLTAFLVLRALHHEPYPEGY